MRSTLTISAICLLAVLFFASVASAQEAAAEAGQPLDVVQAAQPDYKQLYFDALKRIQELEAALQEAIDLALGYRQDWEDQRAIAEARKSQTDQVLKLSETLLSIIADMKDTINKQHEIIMTLTAPKTKLSLMGGVVMFPSDRFKPGILVAAGVNF